MTVPDVKKHPRYGFPDIARKEGLCSLASIPLLFKGSAIGVLNCYTDRSFIGSGSSARNTSPWRKNCWPNPPRSGSIA